MAGLYIKGVDNDLKEWLEGYAKTEGFSTLSGYIKVHFTQLRAEVEAETKPREWRGVETGRIENSSLVEEVEKRGG